MISPKRRSIEDITHALLQTGGLYDQAEAALKRTLAADPQNSQALWKLGEIYRGKGVFEAAVEAYRRFMDLHPDHATAAYLCTVLSDQALPNAAPAQGLWPAPFVRIENFLPPADCHGLLALALAGRETFSRARLANDEYDPHTRSAWRANKHDLNEVASWFFPRLHTVFPDIFPRLQVEDLQRYSIELQMTVHLAGGFFRVHQDNAHERLRSRKVSYVYYFHRKPKRFAGGDLLLYDTDVSNNELTPKFTKITPLNNSIIFFPSGYFHQVTPVQCDTDDFGDGRFTLNGWIRAT